MPDTKPLVKIAPNNPIFDLPVLVGIEEGLFLAAGLDVRMSAPYEAREKDNSQPPIMARLKENLFDCGSAESYNVCERASIDPPAPRPPAANTAAPPPSAPAPGNLSLS